MLAEDDPLYPNWDQDATAVEERYLEQDPSLVSAQLRAAAAELAGAFDAVGGEQWQRRGRRSDGAAFTVASFSLYMVHDPVHHLYDVTGSGWADALRPNLSPGAAAPSRARGGWWRAGSCAAPRPGTPS